jgi:hypothetical protein
MSDELQRLRDRIEDLEIELGCTGNDPLRFLVIRQKERDLLGILLRRETMSKETACMALYGSLVERERPDDKIINVMLSRIRAALRRYDIKIESDYGVGWYIRAAEKAKLREIIERANS